MPLSELTYAGSSQDGDYPSVGDEGPKGHDRCFWGSGHVQFLDLGAGYLEVYFEKIRL